MVVFLQAAAVPGALPREGTQQPDVRGPDARTAVAATDSGPNAPEVVREDGPWQTGQALHDGLRQNVHPTTIYRPWIHHFEVTMIRSFHISNIIELSYSAQASQHAPKDCRGTPRGRERKFQPVFLILTARSAPQGTELNVTVRVSADADRRDGVWDGGHRSPAGSPVGGRHSLPEAGGVAYRHTPGWFPSRRCPHPRRWRSRARPHFRSVSIAPLAPLRGTVPAPTGRTGQRSAQFSRWGLPCLRVAPPGHGRHAPVQRPRGAFCDSASAPEVEKSGPGPAHAGRVWGGRAWPLTACGSLPLSRKHREAADVR